MQMLFQLLIFLVPIGQFLFLIFHESSHSLATFAKDLPIAFMAILIAPNANLSLRRPFIKFTLILSFFVILSLTQVESFDYFYPNDFVIFITSFFIFNADLKIKHSQIRVFSLMNAALFCVASFVIFGPLDFLEPIKGVSTWENNFVTYAMGLLALFFALEKDYLFSIIMAVVFFLAMKRLAFIAFIGLALTNIIAGNFFEKKENRVFFEIIIASFIIFLTFFVNEFFYLFGLDVEFASNRDVIFGFIIQKLQTEVSLNHLLFGFGPGFNIVFMKNFNFDASLPLHNEFFKFFVDYGLFGMMGYLYIIRKLYNFSRKMFFLGMFTLLCAITDSAITNSIYLISFLILAKFYMNNETQDNSIVIA